VGSDDSAPFTFEWKVLYWADGGAHSLSAEATFFDGHTRESQSVSVTVSEAAAQAPGLVGPDQNAFMAQSATLEWRSLPGASGYDVQVSSDPQFATVEVTMNSTDTTAVVTGTAAGPGLRRTGNQGSPDLPQGRGAPVTARLVEVSDCANCSEKVGYGPVRTEPFGFETIPSGTHYWRVRARNPFGLTSVWSDSRQFDMVDVSGVIDGQGIPGAADYVPGPGLHPMVVFGDIPPEDAPEEWRPGSLSALELVANGERYSRSIQVCHYIPVGTITRYRRYFDVDLYAAKTAGIVVQKTFSGGTPKTCPSSYVFYPPYHVSFHGSSVPIETVINFLEGYAGG
jgi:hypothetical protein